MEPITDDYMHQMLPTTRQYSVVILKAGPEKNKSGSDKIIWEHGRRNFSLRADGLLPIVCVGYAHSTTEVRVQWKPPGAAEFSDIPSSLFSH